MARLFLSLMIAFLFSIFMGFLSRSLLSSALQALADRTFCSEATAIAVSGCLQTEPVFTVRCAARAVLQQAVEVRSPSDALEAARVIRYVHARNVI